ncbi:hypothetical protein Tco_1313547 [Tanacetum coccineum]
MLLTFQAVGLEPFLTLDENIYPRFVFEFYHSLEIKRDEEERPYIEFKLGQFTFDRFFGPKHDLFRKNITIPRTTQTQLQRDPNKLHIDDIHPEQRGWELFFRENFFCALGNRDHVNACTAYVLYYLTIKRKFNFTLMILYRMEEVKNKSNGPMPFAMLLTRLYHHMLRTNPQAIVPPDRFTFHDHVMNPLDISRNPIKEREKRVASPSVSSSSSSSSDGNEAPSFLEFCESPTPTHVAPPPKLRFVIPLKLEPQELSLLTSSPNDPYMSTMDNWPLGPSKPSLPPRVTRPLPGFLHPPSGFEQLTTSQPLFVNINNNAPHLHNNAPPLENIQLPPPNLGYQDFPNPPNILDFVHPNDMPHLHNMFCQCCSTTRHEIQTLRNSVNYMFSYIRHHLGSSSNPPYFPH